MSHPVLALPSINTSLIQSHSAIEGRERERFEEGREGEIGGESRQMERNHYHKLINLRMEKKLESRFTATRVNSKRCNTKGRLSRFLDLQNDVQVIISTVPFPSEKKVTRACTSITSGKNTSQSI